MGKVKRDSGLSDLKRALKSGEPGHLYVFYGQESYLREYYLGEIKSCLVPPGLEAFNHIRLEGRGLTPERLFEAVESLPAFAPRKLVTVRDLDVCKPGEALKKALEHLLPDLPAPVCLVFIYDTIPFKPDARTKLYGLLAAAGHIVEFTPQEAADLVPWITRHFKAHGKQIDRKLCEYLLFLCGGLMAGLKNEIGKIAAFAPGAQITREDIDAVALPVLDAVVYQMTDAIARREWTRAMTVLLKLREMREEPVELLAALGRSLRGLYAARLALETRRGARDVMQLMGYRSSYPAERLMQAARQRSSAWCRRAVSLCAQADLSLKTSYGRGDRGRIIEWVIASLENEA